MSGWKKKKKVMRRYDTTASSYDAQYAEEQEAKIQAVLPNLKFEKGCLVLDLGCGTGLLFKHIAGRAKLVVGLDFSTNLLKEAKKRAKKYFNVDLIRADVDHVPFRNQSFHYVFAVTLLQNLPNLHNALEEIRRVTESDAEIVLTALKKQFAKEEFTSILQRANFTYTLQRENQTKDYVAICQKTSIH